MLSFGNIFDLNLHTLAVWVIVCDVAVSRGITPSHNITYQTVFTTLFTLTAVAVTRVVPKMYTPSFSITDTSLGNAPTNVPNSARPTTRLFVACMILLKRLRSIRIKIALKDSYCWYNISRFKSVFNMFFLNFTFTLSFIIHSQIRVSCNTGSFLQITFIWVCHTICSTNGRIIFGAKLRTT